MEQHQFELFSLPQGRKPLRQENQQPRQAERTPHNDNEGPWPYLPFPDGWHAAS